jgi:hypothetical protein
MGWKSSAGENRDQYGTGEPSECKDPRLRGPRTQSITTKSVITRRKINCPVQIEDGMPIDAWWPFEREDAEFFSRFVSVFPRVRFKGLSESLFEGELCLGIRNWSSEIHDKLTRLKGWTLSLYYQDRWGRKNCWNCWECRSEIKPPL